MGSEKNCAHRYKLYIDRVNSLVLYSWEILPILLPAS